MRLAKCGFAMGMDGLADLNADREVDCECPPYERKRHGRFCVNVVMCGIVF